MPRMTDSDLTDAAGAQRSPAAGRVLRLLHAAAAAFDDPHAASAWLHAPHEALLGVTPAAAAWYGPRTADYAMRVLEATMLPAPSGGGLSVEGPDGDRPRP